MKVEELKALEKEDRVFSISFEEDETIEIVSLRKNRINLIVKKERC